MIYYKKYSSYQSAVNGRKYWRSKGYICGKVNKGRRGRNWWFECKSISKKGWW